MEKDKTGHTTFKKTVSEQEVKKVSDMKLQT